LGLLRKGSLKWQDNYKREEGPNKLGANKSEKRLWCNSREGVGEHSSQSHRRIGKRRR
jgi:hypothetical protein